MYVCESFERRMYGDKVYECYRVFYNLLRKDERSEPPQPTVQCTRTLVIVRLVLLNMKLSCLKV